MKLGEVGLCSLFIALISTCFLVVAPSQSAANPSANGPDSRQLIWAAPLYPPWMFKTEQGFEGIMYQVLSEAASRANIELILKPVPIMRMYAYLGSGEADFGLVPTIDEKKRFSEERNIDISPHPILFTSLAVFVNRNRPISEEFSLSEIRNYRLGVIRVPESLSTFSSLSEILVDNKNLVEFKNNLAVVKALKSGRIDLALASSISFIHQASTLGLNNNFEILQYIDTQSGLYVAWSKSSSTVEKSVLIAEFMEALNQIACEGVVEDLFNKWIGEIVSSGKASLEFQENTSGLVKSACVNE